MSRRRRFQIADSYRSMVMRDGNRNRSQGIIGQSLYTVVGIFQDVVTQAQGKLDHVTRWVLRSWGPHRLLTYISSRRLLALLNSGAWIAQCIAFILPHVADGHAWVSFDLSLLLSTLPQKGCIS